MLDREVMLRRGIHKRRKAATGALGAPCIGCSLQGIAFAGSALEFFDTVPFLAGHSGHRQRAGFLRLCAVDSAPARGARGCLAEAAALAGHLLWLPSARHISGWKRRWADAICILLSSSAMQMLVFLAPKRATNFHAESAKLVMYSRDLLGNIPSCHMAHVASMPANESLHID